MPLPLRIQRRGNGACFRLPYLTPEEAWTVVSVLKGLLDSIWRAHGDGMADYQGCVFPDWNPPPDADSNHPDQSEPEASGDADF